MRYRINSDLSARLALRSRTSTEPGVLDDYHSSLNLATTDTTELYALPVSWHKRFSESLAMDLGAGAYVSVVKQQTAGFLQILDPAGTTSQYNTNSYEDETNSSFYGPLAAFGIDLNANPISIKARVEVIPDFFLSAENTFQMSPMVMGTWSDSWTGMGYPYINATLKGRVFFVEMDAQYEFQRYPWHYASSTGSSLPLDWDSAENATEAMTLSHSFTLLANILLPLVKDGDVILGYGRKFLWTDAGDQGSYENNKAVFNVGFDFSR